jgi:hypothetical protein
MNRQFEYQITTQAADQFKQIAFYCSTEGTCTINTLPQKQFEDFTNILNEKGKQGWELVQLIFNQDGAVIFWKRGI